MVTIGETELVHIQEEARALLKKFSISLSKVNVSERKSDGIVGGSRVEGKGTRGNESFREGMFANAPHHDGDAIIAEKKKW